LKRLAGSLGGATIAVLVFSANAHAASVTLSASGNPVAGAPMTITAAGVVEEGTLLFAEVEPPGSFSGGCQTAYPGFGTRLSAYSGDAAGPGNFAKSYTYTPPSAGSYRLCGYLDKSSYETPAATSSGSFYVEAPTGALALTVSPSTANNNQPVTIAASGTTNTAARLVVGVRSLAECSPTTFNTYVGTELNSTGGDPVGPGAFAKAYTYTPTSSGTASVCGFLSVGTVLPTVFGGTSAPLTVLTQEQEEANQKRVDEEAAARERAQRLAELEARRAAALKRPVTRLSVRSIGHNSGSSYGPGYTRLRVTTSPFAHVSVKLSRRGHATYHVEWGEQATAVAIDVPWSCASPGGIYRYVVSARTNVGKTLTRSGRFSPVSPDRCRFLKRREAEARARENRETQEGYEREARAERQRVEHFEHNCRVIGGTPAELEAEGKPLVVCRKQGGGLIPVPQ
jgi:hypothetical protein